MCFGSGDRVVGGGGRERMFVGNVVEWWIRFGVRGVIYEGEYERGEGTVGGLRGVPWECRGMAG